MVYLLIFLKMVNRMDDKLNKTYYINLLLDFYVDLLSTKQKEYLIMYYQDDLSLGEISEKYNVSRSAIYDNINRGLKALKKYEETLGLINKYNDRIKLYEQLKTCVDEVGLGILDKLAELD